MNTSASALARRRRSRRVTDDKRKRAARACDRCKARKSKCIPRTRDQCQRCLQKNLSCRFQREPSPEAGDEVYAASGPTPGHTPDDTLSINSHQADRIVWPRFLSRLREAFSLDLQPTPEARDMMAMQAHIAGPRSLQPSQVHRLSKAIDAFPPRPVADFLISVCIRHGTDCFFYFNQAQLLSDIHEFYSNPTSRLRTDSGFVALALAAFALGSQWTLLEKPPGSSATSATINNEDYDPGKLFHTQLRELVPDLIERPCLQSIQVLYVMAVYLMPSSPVGSSYIYMGLAIRKALAFDLHQCSDDTIVDEIELETRNRLWWSLYSLERITAIKLNRVTSVSKNNISAPLPCPLPSLDSVQVFDNVQHQIAFARLVQILDRIAEAGNVIAESSESATRLSLEKDLKDWKASLPPDFKLSNIHPKSSAYRAVFHLYMNYYYARISMGKTTVVTVVRSYLRTRLSHETAAAQTDIVVRDLADSCIKAAVKILRLFEDLMSTGNIVRLSFTDFQGCSIATIVTLLAGILERDSGYDSRVAFGLECLRKMAAGNMTAKVGVRFVEALQSIANEAVEKLSQREAPSGMTTSDKDAKTASEDTLTGSDYTQWSEWLMGRESASRPLTRPATPTRLSPNAIIVNPMPRLDADSEPITVQGPVNNIVNPPSWDAPGSQEFPSLPVGEVFQHDTAAFPQYMQLSDASLPSLLDGDDQNFLMGLTGLDVLDFSELSTGL